MIDNTTPNPAITATGMLNVVQVNDMMASMTETPDPRQLYGSLWYEGELACLFADSNVGKSVFAVQIGEQIAVDQPVLYVDCELSDKQFQVRYSNPEKSCYHTFPDKFFRATVAPEKIGIGDFEDCLLNDIEAAAIAHNCRVLIIDNLTYVCNTSEKGDAAGIFMMKLKRLQMRYGWSILMIAHTPKRDESRGITKNDLAGSRKLFNFFDTVFALGKSRLDPNFRYLIQVKARSGENEYTEDHVAVFEMEKGEDGALLMLFRKFDKEVIQIELDCEDDASLAENVVRLHQIGKSFRDIASDLGISKSRAQRIFKKYEPRLSQKNEFADGIKDFEMDCPIVPDPEE